MATATISFVSKCAGNNHVTVDATAGTVEKVILLSAPEFTTPVTQEELEAAVKVLLRFKKAADGLSNAQMLAAVQAGITVTL